MTAKAGERSAWIAAAVFVVSTAAMLGAVELVLRWQGHRPWSVVVLHPNEPSVHVPDPVLGWRNKPGRYVVPPYTPGADPIEITFLPDGTRLTGPEGLGAGPELFVVGASFTQGWAVSDRETFAWRIQERFPDLRVRNFGTGGYSTFQSLLALERLLSEGERPERVLYSFVGDLERRNVATPAWIRGLANFSHRGTVDVPFCTLDDGDLVRHAPERYPEWPLAEQLATVALAQEVYSQRRGRDRKSQRLAVTSALLLEMRDLVESRGSEFHVVLLHFYNPQRKAYYLRFLRQNRVDFVDCAFALTPDMQVEGEGHANGRLHARWASCIAPFLEKRLPGGAG